LKPGLLVLILIFLVGCSGFDITHEDYVEGRDSKGYVFYAPKALFMHTCSISDKGAITYSDDIKYVPDYKRPYKLNVHNRLGDNNVKVDFGNGWMLTGIGSDYKSPEATIGKAMDIADNALGAFSEGQKTVEDGNVVLTTSCTSYICEVTEDFYPVNFSGSNCRSITNTKKVVIEVKAAKRK